MGSLLIIVLTIGFLIGVLSPFLPLSIWPLELFSHFQLQYLIGGGALLALARDMRVSAVIICGLFICLFHLLPFAGAGSAGDRPPGSLKILQINVYKFNDHKQEMIRWIRSENPDILVAAEVTPEWQAALSGLDDHLMHGFEKPRKGSHGMAIYSRIPFVKEEVFFPDGENIPALAVDVLNNGKILSLLSLHPTTPVTPLELKMRDRHFALANQWAKEHQESPALVLGDFNVTPFSPAYKKMLAGTDLKNARKGFGVFPSWPSNFPFFMRIPIDHVLYNGGIAIHSFKIGAKTASDHLATVTILSF